MRWIIRIVVALVLMVIVAIGMVFLLPTERIGQIASDQLERATGRKLSLSGRFSPTLYPVLGVKTGRITISNADWAEHPLMIEASGASVGVGLMALFGGKLEITKLRLDDPVIRLERARDGRVNWDFGGTGGGGAGSTAAPDFSLAMGEIVNGSVQYHDQQTAEVIAVSKIDATIALPKDTPALALAGTAVWQGQKIAISAEIANLPKLLGGSVTAVDASFGYGGAKASLVGMVGLGNGTPTVDGSVSVTLADLAQMQDLLGVLPTPLQKMRDIAVNGQLQASSAGMYFSGDAGMQVDGLPVKATVELTGDGDWQQSLAFDLDTKITSDALVLSFDGRVNLAKSAARGNLDMSSDDPRRLLSLAGLSADLPTGVFGRFAITGDLGVQSSGDVFLKKARFVVDRNVLTGQVSIATSGKPLITANLSAKSLDVSGFTSDTGGSGDGNGSVGWSKEPIALAGLDAVDADIMLKAGSVNLGTTKLGLTHVKAKLRKGLLTLRLIDVRAFQGAMSGTVRVRGGNGIAFDSDLLAKDMQLEPLLGELLDMDRLIGSGTTKLKLAGRGASLHQVMNSLSGTGDIKFANGAFRGIDLAAMMNNLKSAFGGFEGATEFTSMTGSFTLNKGVLENVDLLMVSPLFKAEGKGRISIGGQSMDYVVTPSTLNGKAKVSVPVMITGPWDDLKFRPDLKKLIDLVLQGKLKDNAAVQKARKKLEKAKAKLKDPEVAVKAKLRKKLAKKLGNNNADKDALKQQVEDKIGKALLKLFE